MVFRRIAVFLGVSAGMLALSGCAGTQAPAGGSPAALGELPRPAAAGEVLAQGMVLQKDGQEPELCLGAIAESYPPQCGGPKVSGWDWASVEQSENASGITWGSYAVIGTWDATSFTVTQTPIPLSLYDAVAQPDPRLDPAQAGESDEATVLQAQTTLHADDYPPTVLGDWIENGYLWVSVIYDDGTVQKHFDETLGRGIVAVQSALSAVE
jgi:hypothetical protein